MKNILVYSCITNGYDWLLPPVLRSSHIKHICFTDNPELKGKGWEVRRLPSGVEFSNGAVANRYCKFFPWKMLPEHDWSLYIDANIRLMTDPSPVVADMEATGLELAIPSHPQRCDIWQEAEACKRFGKIPGPDLPELDAQLERYQAEGVPQNIGLTENNIIFRTGDPTRLMPVMEKWWEELQNGVKRDQISLPYVLWSTETSIRRLPFSARDANPYFRIVPHRGSGGIYNYLHAQRYHGFIWEAAFRAMRIYRTRRRRTMNLFRRTNAR